MYKLTHKLFIEARLLGKLLLKFFDGKMKSNNCVPVS